jgi:hypothetical protein
MIAFRAIGEIRPPNSCRVSAATPAALGAAADVPKKRQAPWVVVGQVPEPKGPTPLTETPSAASQYGAVKLRDEPPETPLHGPGFPPGHRVVVTICVGPAALKGSWAMVAGSTDVLALTAPALVAKPR